MSSESSPLRRVLAATEQWLKRTPDRALDQAYDAVLKIKAIEDEHFAGQQVIPGAYSRSGQDFFESDINQYLRIARVRLAEFKTSRRFLALSDRRALGFGQFNAQPGSQSGPELRSAADLESDTDKTIVVEKLRFVDTILERYRNSESTIDRSTALIQLNTSPTSPTLVQSGTQPKATDSPKTDPLSRNSSTGEPRVLPRSLLNTVDRIRENLDPEAESTVINRFRSTKKQTTMALRFFLLLILVPLLVQQATKILVVGPLVDSTYSHSRPANVFLNHEFEEEALRELNHYREQMEFRSLIGVDPVFSREELEEKLRDRASEIATEFQAKGADAIKNIFADLLATFTFAIILLNNRVQLSALKAFFDEIVYGLSDSAKAFVLILLTDVFVGFHSPHGWEVLLEGISRHLGIPASHDFIFLFIATFPVILDTVFKYWIFRYLNRISPSAVATYKNMNE